MNGKLIAAVATISVAAGVGLTFAAKATGKFVKGKIAKHKAKKAEKAAAKAAPVEDVEEASSEE
jgi:hypothetical protein